MYVLYKVRYHSYIYKKKGLSTTKMILFFSGLFSQPLGYCENEGCLFGDLSILGWLVRFHSP